MGTSQNSKPKGWQWPEAYSLALPEGAQLPPALPPALAAIDHNSTELPLAISVDYPLLRRRLRELGLTFRPTFTQGAAAQIIARSDRTLRRWTRIGKISCHCWFDNRHPYYTAENLEAFFTATPGKAA